LIDAGHIDLNKVKQKCFLDKHWNFIMNDWIYYVHCKNEYALSNKKNVATDYKQYY